MFACSIFVLVLKALIALFIYSFLYSCGEPQQPIPCLARDTIPPIFQS